MARIGNRVRGAGAAEWAKLADRGGTVRARLNDLVARRRRQWGWFDHAARAYGRYQQSRGGSLAGATTFFAFLSFFPLLALAFSVAGYAAVLSTHAAAWVTAAIHSVLPRLANQLPLSAIARARAGAGAFGLLGLLIAGLGGIGSVRDGLHVIWDSAPDSGNVVARKARDAAVLGALGLCLLLSAVSSALAVSATRGAFGSAGLGGSALAQAAVWVLALAIALIFDTVMFGLTFSRLSGAHVPRLRLLRGALVAAVAFEVLKLTGVYLVTRTTRNPVYASFAVMAGLLVWMNLVARLTYLAAAWTATAAGYPGRGADAGPAA